jgi:hypothetical protein
MSSRRVVRKGSGQGSLLMALMSDHDGSMVWSWERYASAESWSPSCACAMARRAVVFSISLGGMPRVVECLRNVAACSV